MSFYIPPFWLGVISTVCVEIVLTILLIIVVGGKDGNRENNNDKSNE